MLMLAISEGDRLEIGDRVLFVQTLSPDGKVTFSLDGDPEPVVVLWDRKTLVLPEVAMFVSLNEARSSQVRLAVEAPRSIKIKRVPDGARPPKDNGQPKRHSASQD